MALEDTNRFDDDETGRFAQLAVAELQAAPGGDRLDMGGAVGTAASLVRYADALLPAAQVGHAALLFEAERMGADKNQRLVAVAIARHRHAGVTTAEHLMAAMTGPELELLSNVLHRRSSRGSQ